VEARMTEDPLELALIVELLLDGVVARADRDLFLASVPAFMAQSPPFRFFLASDGPVIEDVAAGGFVTMMEAPWIEEKVLAVDGLWLREESGEVAELVLRHLLTFARRLDFGALCIAPRSTNRAEFLGSMLPQGLGGTRILLQAYVPGVYSAFTSGPLGSSAFFSETAALATITPGFDVSGAE
jgi:hypothetical protein